MPTVTFPAGGNNFAFIVREGNGYISREEVVIASGAGVLAAGTILGKITASGKFKGALTANSDGSQTAAAILLEDVDATSADVKRAVLVRHAEVQKSELKFVGTPTTNEKNAMYASLALNAVIMR